ncbi:hypothetical protein O6P43_013317 [Quillaja saponaria]|uniref:Uncharacterized protein n=1 Tax=Quillaja saponaria TaxID=32244 RepID=A0AAD7PV43_QUISA|nr:hypothetical protein O6P43_013317 [Quillaja saponaria]
MEPSRNDIQKTLWPSKPPPQRGSPSKASPKKPTAADIQKVLWPPKPPPQHGSTSKAGPKQPTVADIFATKYPVQNQTRSNQQLSQFQNQALCPRFPVPQSILGKKSNKYVAHPLQVLEKKSHRQVKLFFVIQKPPVPEETKRNPSQKSKMKRLSWWF